MSEQQASPGQQEQAQQFRSAHKPGEPLILFNAWDAGSAQAIAATPGAAAIATGSAPVAMAHGYPDGEAIPIELALANIERIVRTVELPVSIDLEGGYGVEAGTVAANVIRALKTGVVGFNFEDQVVGGKGLHNTSVQARRISAARDAAQSHGVDAFINARTDTFLKAPLEEHNDAMLGAAIERARAYEAAGADGFFAPGLADESLISTLCESLTIPVNIIALPHVPPKERLAALGVARISHGPVPYRRMIQWLGEQAAAAFN